MSEETIIESAIAKAGVVTEAFLVYDEDALIEMAKDPRFRYDPANKTLYLRVQLKPIDDTVWKSNG